MQPHSLEYQALPYEKVQTQFPYPLRPPDSRYFYFLRYQIPLYRPGFTTNKAVGIFACGFRAGSMGRYAGR